MATTDIQDDRRHAPCDNQCLFAIGEGSTGYSAKNIEALNLDIGINLLNKFDMENFTIQLGDWTTLQADAQSVRTAVFVVEQKIPAELEWDVMDAQCLHAVAYDEAKRPVGTGRLLPDGHIGRMAVLASARGSGVGAALLRLLMEQARVRGELGVQLNAQLSAESFYQRAGFTREGELFDEAGIPHVHMTKQF